MIEERIDKLIETYNGKIDKCRKDREDYKFALFGSANGNTSVLIERYARCITCCDNEIEMYESFIKSLEYAKTGETKWIIKNWKKT